jgi:hypothetical protein
VSLMREGWEWLSMAPRHALVRSRAAGATDGAIRSREWRAAQIREWLLLLLRFAITRNPSDEAVVLSLANEIDSPGPQQKQSAPTFFRRTSSEICTAIITHDDPKRDDILTGHLARIDDLRLRRAFHAAIDLADRPPQAIARNLWAGLAR